MKTYSNDVHIFYSVDNIIKEFPKTFVGCRTKKDFVKRHGFEHMIDFGYFRKDSNGKWIMSNGSSRKFDKIFILVKSFDKKFKGSHLLDNSDIIEAPDILELEKNEMFRDDDGNIVEIEVRGVRKSNACYFKVKDVAKGFEIFNLQDTIIDSRTCYTEHDHYVYFYDSGGSRNKQLYLTYTGLMRVLFASTTKIADSFLKWATDTLFTAHLGTKTDKVKLASKITGASVDEVNSVVSKSASPIACVYLFSLGTVKDLSESLNIPESFSDTMIVAKYGKTKNIVQRTKDHKSDYGKLKGSCIKLKCFGIIDPEYISEAEARLSNLFRIAKNKLKHDKYIELIIIDEKDVDDIRKEYSDITNHYCIKNANISSMIKDEQHLNEILQERLDYQKKLHDQEIELIKERHKNEILELKLKYSHYEN